MLMVELDPEQISVLEHQAQNTQPGELIATADQTLALIRHWREMHAAAVNLAQENAVLTERRRAAEALAQDLRRHRDVQLAAVGRILHAALQGRDVRNFI
jgi:hypothetical protein